MNRILKYIKFLIFTVLFTIVGNITFGQDIIQDINKGFGSGDIEYLKRHLNGNLDLSFDQQKSIYSKSQALSLLKQRFDNEPPKIYKLLKSSDFNNKNTFYLISEYQTNKAKYLVYLSIKKEKDGMKITEIHFESQ